MAGRGQWGGGDWGGDLLFVKSGSDKFVKRVISKLLKCGFAFESFWLLEYVYPNHRGFLKPRRSDTVKERVNESGNRAHIFKSLCSELRCVQKVGSGNQSLNLASSRMPYPTAQHVSRTYCL